jgi:hypothetical protein
MKEALLPGNTKETRQCEELKSAAEFAAPAAFSPTAGS